MRGHLAADLRTSDIVRITTSQWRREWEAKELAKLVAAAQKANRPYDTQQLMKTVRSKTLSEADREQRDKKIAAAQSQHSKLFDALKRKREETTPRPGASARPIKRRVSGEKGLMSANMKENVVIDSASTASISTRRTRSQVL